MTLIEARTVSLPSPGLVKMEERKRPAVDGNDESVPPPKRQATARASIGGRSDKDSDMPGKDDLDVSCDSHQPPKNLQP